jgi:hypothetical protein
VTSLTLSTTTIPTLICCFYQRHYWLPSPPPTSLCEQGTHYWIFSITHTHRTHTPFGTRFLSALSFTTRSLTSWSSRSNTASSFFHPAVLDHLRISYLSVGAASIPILASPHLLSIEHIHHFKSPNLPSLPPSLGHSLATSPQRWIISTGLARTSHPLNPTLLLTMSMMMMIIIIISSSSSSQISLF